MFNDEKVAMIGAGSMAEAIISGILKKKFLPPELIWVTNRSNDDHLNRLKEKYGVMIAKEKEAVIRDASIIILAMKPKDVKEGLRSISHDVSGDQLVISVIAGISTDFISEHLPEGIAVIRAMPNTSAAVGQSATALAKGNYATDRHVEKAKALFSTIGSVSCVEEEDLHVVTGLSGSGPAYLYYLAEAFEESALRLGLDQGVAKELIIQTFVGAAEMLKKSELPPETLRQQVTSPGGTTEAGIQTLEDYQVKEAVYECIQSASKRSRELGKWFHSPAKR